MEYIKKGMKLEIAAHHNIRLFIVINRQFYYKYKDASVSTATSRPFIHTTYRNCTSDSRESDSYSSIAK